MSLATGHVYGTGTLGSLWACLHEGGGPQVGEVTCGGLPHLSCKRDHIKMRDYMDRWITPPKRVTSPTRGPSPPCKQALMPILVANYKDLYVRNTRAIWLKHA